MPKLRAADIEDIDIEALEAVEYSTEEFDRYDGDTPPIGLTLAGYVKKMWWTRSQPKANGQGDDAMLKILWVADGNEGDLEQYNGCPYWLNVPLIASAKFKWDPWMLAYGFTLRKVLTTTYVSKKEDQNGAPIERIGTWHPGAESDEAWCYIVTDQEPYGGAMKPAVKEWIAWDDLDGEAPADDEPEDVEDEEDTEEEEEAEDEEDEEEEEAEDEDEEDEPESPRPSRQSRSAPARGSRTAAKPATAKTGRRTGSARASASPAATARSGARRTAKTPAVTAPARSTRTKRRAAGNEPPF